MAFIDDIRRTYSGSSLLTRIIFINIGVFLLLRILAVGALLFNVNIEGMLHWVDVSSNLGVLLRRPWTVVTFMFAHFDVWSILFNLLWLYWIGRIFMEFFSPKQLMGVYLLGGWAGMLLFLLAYNILPHLVGLQNCLIGASASVLAIVVATAVYVPDYKIGLLFLGEVSLKWIAIVVIIFTVLTLDKTNLGSSLAHIGGMLVGAWYALRIRRGRDITRPLNAVIDSVFGLFNGRSWKSLKSMTAKKASPASGTRKQTSRADRPADEVSEEELDRILGKIKTAGYDALTDEERDQLFKASRRRNV
ncbi:MAG: rhomboid family intramembrane serine protease [Muribaculaceae bacterium]|nr:rhomboid family intramembrane serine protease [Muribaculaceae bacterium]